ncbi:Lrp/AsnC family transcriptional regulator [Kiloniella sp.]|uniref:Lrp/AsnC family transcriptional regulator n=1 Tax=Kiloniella sp. TaxID=1938587 RepID=UPI003A8F74D2
MNETDRKILSLLQDNNKTSMTTLAEHTGLSVSAVNDRVRKLQSNGTIIENCAIVDPEALGLGLLAFLFIDLHQNTDEEAFIQQMKRFAEVQELHHVTGQHNYMAKVRVKNTKGLQSFLSQKLKRQQGVAQTETLIVLQSEKETTALPT